MLRLACAWLAVVLVFGCAVQKPAVATASNTPYLERKDVQGFVSEMEAEGFNREYLEQALGAAVYQQKIIDAISKPAERVLTWETYQDIFLTRRRLDRGVDFLRDYDETFQRAEEVYGVPREIVAAIIGVETFYGRIKGGHRVIDALTTLAFDYPPRAKFFRSELKEYFYLVREENKAATEPVGSYAGAMGYGQFISSSYRHYAVDFDGDGVRDIWENPVDAIGSVANYLARHGWQKAAPIVTRVAYEGQDHEMFNESLKPSRTINEVSALGIEVNRAGTANETVSPMRLSGKKGDEYWIGFNNFYVITRYNHSKLYAMAVFQLSEQIKAAAQSNRE